MSNKQTLDHALDLLHEEEGILQEDVCGFGLFKNEISVALILDSGIYMLII